MELRRSSVGLHVLRAVWGRSTEPQHQIDRVGMAAVQTRARSWDDRDAAKSCGQAGRPSRERDLEADVQDLVGERLRGGSEGRREARPLSGRVAAAINALRFSVLTPGGTPPAQERMSLDRSGVSARSFFTAAVTSAGEPLASTSRGGMLPRMREPVGGHLPQLGEGVEDAGVVEVDANLRIVADGFGALGVVVEELHGHVRCIEFLEVGQAKLLEVLFADEPNDVVQQEHAVDGGEGLALEFVPLLEELA